MIFKKKVIEKDIARQRINILFKKAEKEYFQDKDLSRMYIALILKIARHTNVRLKKKYRLRICKKCNSILIPSVNCKIRIRSKREKHLVIHCLECGYFWRHPIR